MVERVDVAVIGAGPAGIAFARELVRRGGAPLVLEAGPCAGDSWRRMPRDMRLNSAWGASCLPGTFVAPWDYARRVPRERFHRHLVDVAASAGFELRTEWPVRSIRPTSDGFEVRSRRGAVRARRVVNATGYFSNPHLPDTPGLETCTIPQITVPTYGSVDAVAERIGSGPRTIGIVGDRITAGQLALELHDAGHTVWISNRAPISFAPPIGIQQLGFVAYYPYEAIRLRIGSYRQRSSALRMAGGRIARLIRSEEVRTTGLIARFDREKVHMANGSVETADAILWATGYRPALAHLPAEIARDAETGLPRLDDTESRDLPGFHFLGLDAQTDFTSRMLRGLRRDAVRLARKLAAGTPSAGGL